MCKNTSSVNISKNLIIHLRNNIFTIKLYFLREQVTRNVITQKYLATKYQLVDIFIKPLAREPFGYLRQQIGVVTPPSKWLHFGKWWKLLSMGVHGRVGCRGLGGLFKKYSLQLMLEEENINGKLEKTMSRLRGSIWCCHQCQMGRLLDIW